MWLPHVVLLLPTHLHTFAQYQTLQFEWCAVKKGDRIAQLILERIMTPDVEVVQELGSTVRGAGGYGSTGVGG